jgi:hypothetical protein
MITSSRYRLPKATEERYEQVIEYRRDRSTAGKPPFLRPILAKYEMIATSASMLQNFEIIQDSDYEKLLHHVEGYMRELCYVGISNGYAYESRI